MKEIKLSQRSKKSKNRGLVALVDDADFDYLNQWNWSGEKHRNTFYAHRVDTTGEKRIKIKMHRLVVNITDPKVLVDHKDCNGLNNCKSNLRVCTSSQNAMNRASQKNTSSQYKGVYLNKDTNKWAAEIRGQNHNRKYLGLFVSENDAAIAYNEAAKIMHGEFAKLNIVA